MSGCILGCGPHFGVSGCMLGCGAHFGVSGCILGGGAHFGVPGCMLGCGAHLRVIMENCNRGFLTAGGRRPGAPKFKVTFSRLHVFKNEKTLHVKTFAKFTFFPSKSCQKR